MGAAGVGSSEVEEYLQVGKEVVLNTVMTASTAVGTGSRLDPAVEKENFKTYVGTEQGKVRNCYLPIFVTTFRPLLIWVII